MKSIFVVQFLFISLLLSFGCESKNRDIKVGSKKFTESVILGEIISQISEAENLETRHLKELGGTRLLWNALLKGEIDAYPEYTGTIKEEILADKSISTSSELENELNNQGILISRSLGFNNTYAIGMKKDTADELGIEKISDLNKYPELNFGFTSEFINRRDGWPGLKAVYKLNHRNVKGMDHDLAYRGLESGSIDIIDLYSTDAEIKYYDIKVLEDDLKYFPEYNSVILYRVDLKDNFPLLVNTILKLEGLISEDEMVNMNTKVKIEGENESETASNFINQYLSIKTSPKTHTLLQRLLTTTKQHLFLVLISLTAAIIISIPLGIICYKYQHIGQFVLGIVGIVQTIPSLALLVFMIPFFGIGTIPAIIALFLYSLLPIVRNTYTGLNDIPKEIIESADALGLREYNRLRLIEIPLSSRSILAGIKTSAVINVGTATLGALIGAGGYGQPILTGIRLDNIGLILEGAIPAAVLALLVQWLFDLSEKVFVPRGLRLKN